MERRLRLSVLVVALAATSAIGAAADLGAPVTIAWDSNREPGIAGYRVYVGSASNVYDETVDAGNTTTFTYRSGVAGRRYYFAVSAYTASNLEGPRSQEMSIVIGGATGTPPEDGGGSGDGGGTDPGGGTSEPGDGGGGSPPEDDPPGIVLEPPAVTNHSVVFRWTAVGSLEALEYLLEVGTTPGASDVYNASAGTTTTLSATVQNGSFFARVRARTPDAESVVSNEVGFAIGKRGCGRPPKTPTDLEGSIASGVATIAWKRAARATSYVLQIGTAAGRSDLFDGNVGATPVTTARVLTHSSIYVRVIGVNACGRSAASAEVRLQ